MQIVIQKQTDYKVVSIKTNTYRKTVAVLTKAVLQTNHHVQSCHGFVFEPVMSRTDQISKQCTWIHNDCLTQY